MEKIFILKYGKELNFVSAIKTCLFKNIYNPCRATLKPIIEFKNF